ncbi:MAG: 3-dehydroquinate synthase [Bacteroidales bacterium]|nr:3-dehydroquinate synthase [Bacteroidales bacterium]
MKNTHSYTQDLSLSTDISYDLAQFTVEFSDDKIFVLLDSNTYEYCWDFVKSFRNIPKNQILIIEPGEENKSLSQVELVWNFLGEQKADRKSILINIGGGMLTDLGGFAASTFKRGIDFLNVPTTLLAMVDASVGGKTGINFRGLKNEIGVIQKALHVFMYLPFLRTIDEENYLSGFAEMLKVAIIGDVKLWSELKEFDLEEKSEEIIARLLWRSVMIKKEIIELDPRETGIRKALNFGHTVGHALESICLSDNHHLLHGYAVAFGMAIEASLSYSFASLSSDEAHDIQETIRRIYGKAPIELKEREKLIAYMRFDKKNEHNQINFTLVNKIGSFKINNYINEEHISGAISMQTPISR